MAVIRSNESLVPFFGERLSFIRGLDPLGLQNTSEATFTLLLPGLNNVTGRIRYYSFYCWLLDEYSKQIGSTNPLEQRKFIRRAEYIVALVSQFIESDPNSIPGSNYATNEIRNNKTGIYNLQEGTYKSDGATRDTYWNYGSGAFGQYYLGSLQDIGIVASRENNAEIFVRTPEQNELYISGEALAKAFDTNITTENKKLFFKSIKEGKISEKELKFLIPSFNLSVVPKDTVEQKSLIELLLQKDFPLRIEEEPLTFRKQSIRHLLNYANTTEEDDSLYDRAFVYSCYNSKGNNQNEEDECLLGWYYYQLNEFWQYANTAILNSTLAYLEMKAGPNFMHLSSMVSEITEKTIKELMKMKFISSDESTLGELIKKATKKNTEYNYFEEIGGTNHILSIANSILLIATLFENNKDMVDRLKHYATQNQIERDGEAISYFLKLGSILNKSITDYLFEFLYSRIIYRHQYVALKKIGGGSLSTQKFIIEDHHIRYLGNFEAGFTGPRIGRLLSFLRDLNVISSNDQLTKEGKKILSTLSA